MLLLLGNEVEKEDFRKGRGEREGNGEKRGAFFEVTRVRGAQEEDGKEERKGEEEKREEEEREEKRILANPALIVSDSKKKPKRTKKNRESGCQKRM